MYFMTKKLFFTALLFAVVSVECVHAQIETLIWTGDWRYGLNIGSSMRLGNKAGFSSDLYSMETFYGENFKHSLSGPSIGFTTGGYESYWDWFEYGIQMSLMYQRNKTTFDVFNAAGDRIEIENTDNTFSADVLWRCGYKPTEAATVSLGAGFMFLVPHNYKINTTALQGTLGGETGLKGSDNKSHYLGAQGELAFTYLFGERFFAQLTGRYIYFGSDRTYGSDHYGVNAKLDNFSQISVFATIGIRTYADNYRH